MFNFDYDSLVTALALGTARRPVSEELRAGIDGLAPDDPPTDDAEYLLLATALAERQQRLRLRKAPAPTTAPKTTPIEDERPATGKLARGLELIFGGTFPELLPEALELLQKRKLVVPPVFLPRLLDLAVAETDRDPTTALRYLAGGGTRARWLANQHPDWAPLSPDFDHAEALRLAATPSNQRQVLRLWRLRDPVSAATALGERAKKTNATNLVKLLDALTVNSLVSDTDPLLGLLKTKSKAVRARLTPLLSALPHPPTIDELAQLAYASLNDDLTIRRVLPSDHAKELLKKYGAPAAKTTLADHLLTIIPLSAWEQATGGRLPALWAANRPRINRVIDAASQSASPEERLELLAFLIDTDARDLPHQYLPSLLASIPGADLRAFFDRLLTDYTDVLYPEGPALQLALATNRSWSERMSKAAIGQLLRYVAQSTYGISNQVHSSWRGAIPLLDPAIFPWLRSQLAAAAERPDAYGSLALRTLQTTSFRLQLHE